MSRISVGPRKSQKINGKYVDLDPPLTILLEDSLAMLNNKKIIPIDQLTKTASDIQVERTLDYEWPWEIECRHDNVIKITGAGYKFLATFIAKTAHNHYADVVLVNTVTGERINTKDQDLSQWPQEEEETNDSDGIGRRTGQSGTLSVPA